MNLGPDEIGLAVAGCLIGIPIGFVGAMFVLGLCRAAHRGDVLSETIDDKADQLLQERRDIARAQNFFAREIHTDDTHHAQPGAQPRPGSSTSH